MVLIMLFGHRITTLVRVTTLFRVATLVTVTAFVRATTLIAVTTLVRIKFSFFLKVNITFGTIGPLNIFLVYLTINNQ